MYISENIVDTQTNHRISEFNLDFGDFIESQPIYPLDRCVTWELSMMMMTMIRTNSIGEENLLFVMHLENKAWRILGMRDYLNGASIRQMILKSSYKRQQTLVHCDFERIPNNHFHR